VGQSNQDGLAVRLDRFPTGTAHPIERLNDVAANGAKGAAAVDLRRDAEGRLGFGPVLST